MSARSAVFVAMSRFRVANGMSPQVKRAFRARPHLVDGAPGFVRMDVISPHDDPAELWLLTYWRDETSYRRWHQSAAHRASHRYIPKGLKLVPRSAAVRYFEHVGS